MTQTNDLTSGITRGAQSTLLIAGGTVIWIDPFRVERGDPKADVLFITHAHGDHMSDPDARKVVKDGTVIVGPPDCIGIGGVPESRRISVAPGDRRTIEGIDVEVVPAYNIDKPFHPRSNNWVGYILSVNGRRIYHAGDTDRIPEMKDMRADVAFLPIGGTYTMTAEEAAAAAREDLKPRLAVPMHYGAVVGSDADADRFVARCGDVATQIMKPSL
jgi:L-ascorbate metabolism protein UlaG (beta-lactamase superfamily)